MPKIIAQGAEAVIRKENNEIVKERLSKGYRIKEIDDSLRKRRTRLEAKLIREARRAGVATPQIIEESRFSIKMDFIDGDRIKELVSRKNFKTIAKKIGESVALMHTYNIIHGDLTTSNMIQKDESVYFIDFGLGFFSGRAEDKATDLHVLKEAIQATHFDIAGKFWPAVTKAYANNYTDSEKVIKALAKIEKRGRYVER